MVSPDARRVSKPQAESFIGDACAPHRAKAAASSFTAQSVLSAAMAIRSPPSMRAARASAKRGIEKLMRDGTGAERLAALQRCYDRHRRTEQHRIDLVEVALIEAKYLGKRPAVIPGPYARQILGKLARPRRRTIDEKLHLPAIDDRVVGAAHRGDEIGMRRRQRRRAEAVDNIGQGKMQRMRLVQRDFEHARGNLHAAGKALRRRIDEGEALGRDA